jgi:hypothetical protein
MDTIHLQHKLACTEALDLYASIEAAIDDRRIGFAKETAKNRKAFLENRGHHVSRRPRRFFPTT